MTQNLQVITSAVSPSALLDMTAKRVLLAGEVVFSSLSAATPTGFVVQMQREAATGLLVQFNKNAPKVHVAIDHRIFDISKARVALAFDGYLAWGLRQRSKVPIILFGGGEAEGGVNVEIMIFSKRSLVELREKSLPAIGTMYFQDSLTAMLAELRLAHPTARFVQAAPLSNWALADVEYIDNKPLRRLTYKPLARTFNDRSSYVVPGALAMLGLMIYPTMVMSGWAAYNKSIVDYEQAVSDPAIKSKDGMDTDYLTLMNSRRMYMDHPRRQSTLADKSASIVLGIATVPNVQIVEIKLPAPGANSPDHKAVLSVDPQSAKQQRANVNNDRPADVWISIAAPKAGEVAIEQAKNLMMEVANSTGMSLRLAHQGWRDDGKRRIFNIEGFIHD